MEQFTPDPNDYVDIWIVLKKEFIKGQGETDIIIAWSWDKELAKSYMEFHQCKQMKLTHRKGYYRDIMKSLAEYPGAELTIGYIHTLDPDSDKKKLKEYAIPMTQNEGNLLSAERNSAGGGLVNYNRIIDMFYYLKDEYQEALAGLLFKEAYTTAKGGRTNFGNTVKFDDLQLLLRISPDKFD